MINRTTAAMGHKHPRGMGPPGTNTPGEWDHHDTNTPGEWDHRGTNTPGEWDHHMKKKMSTENRESGTDHSRNFPLPRQPILKNPHVSGREKTVFREI